MIRAENTLSSLMDANCSRLPNAWSELAPGGKQVRYVGLALESGGRLPPP